MITKQNLCLRSTPIIIAILVAVSGCGKTERGAVTGHVYLNDRPLIHGTITFQPLARPVCDHPAAWTTIEQGRFELPQEKGPGLGQCRVEIRSLKQTNRSAPSPVPSADGGPGEPIKLMIEAVPDRFNKESQLVVEIKGGINSLSFRL